VRAEIALVTAIADLRRHLERQSTEMQRMQQTQRRLESELRSGEAGRQDLTLQRTDGAAEAGSGTIRNRVNSAETRFADQ